MTTTIESTVDIPAQRRIRRDGDALNVAAELASRFARGAAERDAHRRLPFPELAVLSRSGLPAITIPRSLGGTDVSTRTLVEVLRRIAAADPSIAAVLRSHFAAVEAIRDHAPLDLLAEVAEGRRLAIAEKDGGDRTIVASTSDDAFVVDGVKRRATGAIFAHRIAVRAGDRIAFVSAESRGVLLLDDWGGVGFRTAASGTVQLSGARVTHAFEAGADGLRSQLLAAAIGTGIATGAVDDAAGMLDADADPLLVDGFGEIYLRAKGAEAVLADAAAAVDSGAAEAELAVASARAIGIRTATEVTGALYELVGPRAESGSSTLHRHWREARAHAVLDPAHDAVQVVGRRALRRPA